jgi:hypothetical protein
MFSKILFLSVLFFNLSAIAQDRNEAECAILKDGWVTLNHSPAHWVIGNWIRTVENAINQNLRSIELPISHALRKEGEIAFGKYQEQRELPEGKAYFIYALGQLKKAGAIEEKSGMAADFVGFDSTLLITKDKFKTVLEKLVDLKSGGTYEVSCDERIPGMINVYKALKKVGIRSYGRDGYQQSVGVTIHAECQYDMIGSAKSKAQVILGCLN